MARKKYFEDADDDDEGGRKCQGEDVLKTFHNHHFLGGGTKGEYMHKNSEEYDGDVGKQLKSLGLCVREMPGDGNCLFRALSDQITGSSRDHLEYRMAVVQYMKEFRADFEPFVEDNVPFDKYVQRLSQPGTFAGNDAIVAFARLHNVSVVIHQLNSPAWFIHPSKDSQQGGREVHIFYHNDHYNSVIPIRGSGSNGKISRSSSEEEKGLKKKSSLAIVHHPIGKNLSSQLTDSQETEDMHSTNTSNISNITISKPPPSMDDYEEHERPKFNIVI